MIGQASYAGVASVCLLTSSQGRTMTLQAKACCGDAADPEYRFLMRSEVESEYTVQDFSNKDSATVTLMEGERVEIRVEARTEGADRIAYDAVWIEP